MYFAAVGLMGLAAGAATPAFASPIGKAGKAIRETAGQHIVTRNVKSVPGKGALHGAAYYIGSTPRAAVSTPWNALMLGVQVSALAIEGADKAGTAVYNGAKAALNPKSHKGAMWRAIGVSAGITGATAVGLHTKAFQNFGAAVKTAAIQTGHAIADGAQAVGTFVAQHPEAAIAAPAAWTLAKPLVWLREARRDQRQRAGNWNQ
jgi:hypothetical protein